MQREIEFRGKQVDSGEWYFGYFVRDELSKLPYITSGGKAMHEIIPETLGQFTGMKDMNGNKIFEGDIVRLDGKIFAVAYDKGAFGLHRDDNSRGNLFHWYNFCRLTHEPYVPEIIGNIHDNPDLLDSNKNPFKGRDDERKCRCNQCTAEFMEGEIVVKGYAEYCPSCGESGCIADDIEAAKCGCGGRCDPALRHNG